jgi:hypothetical protein
LTVRFVHPCFLSVAVDLLQPYVCWNSKEITDFSERRQPTEPASVTTTPQASGTAGVKQSENRRFS